METKEAHTVLEDAQIKALVKIYEDISQTGKPTQEQMCLLRLLEKREEQFTPEKLIKGMDTVLDFMNGGKKHD